MTLKNTTLDDLSAVIGFSAAMRLSAWYAGGRGGSVYVPVRAEEGQMLVRLLGMSAAKRLSENWPGEHIAVPRPQQYDSDVQRSQIVALLAKGFTSRGIGHFLRITERRVQQIIRELETAGLIAPVVLEEKVPEEKPMQKLKRKNQGKNPG